MVVETNKTFNGKMDLGEEQIHISSITTAKIFLILLHNEIHLNLASFPLLDHSETPFLISEYL